MAVEYIAQAAKLELGPRDKFVLVALANYANDEGKAWPKQSTLAKWTGYNRGTIIRALESLEGAGLIRSVERRYADGRNASKVYALTIGGSVAETNPDTASVEESNSVRVDESDTGRVDETNSNNRQPLPVNLDPSLKNNISPIGDTLATLKTINPVEQVVAAWNEHCGPLPQAKVVNDFRERHIKKLIKNLGVTDAIAAMSIGAAEVANDPWWLKHRYGLDNILREQKVIQKAESAMSRGTVNREEAEAQRMLRALRSTAA